MVVALAALIVGLAACHNNKVKNPLAAVDSKQPDKSLYDNALKAMRDHRYDTARQLLSTLINTYPDSEYVARAKLSIGDAWYYEGGAAGLAQAENEYRDFRTFFPNMAEAAEAQMKVADIHYQAMEKPDRDYTHAKRAEEEYREMLLQYPDSKLAEKARLRLLEVQEVLAEREFRIGKFYQTHEGFSAAIARLKTLADTYPLYSQADQALLSLGQCYEGEIARARVMPFKPEVKSVLIKQAEDSAAEAYARVVTRYPAAPAYNAARERLKALDRPVPVPTQDAIAQNKKEIASRRRPASSWHLMTRMSARPNDSIAVATKVGMPTLTDPKPTDAPALEKQTLSTVQAVLVANHEAGGKSGATVVSGAAAPGANQEAPRSDAAAAGGSTPAAADNNTPAPAPAQVNEADPATATAEAQKAATALGSSSKKKKKHGLSKLNPF
jgi:outer membrane protein assembly factor BamD